MATTADSNQSTPLRAARPYLAGGDEAYRLRGWQWLVIWAVGLTTLVIGLGRGRVLTYHELGYAQPAREMLATGNFVVPMIAGVPFAEKPPLAMWTVALAMAVTGSDSEAVVRLPSVVCALLTASLVALLAARWFGNHVGFLAGAIQLSTVHVAMQARLAESDTHLALTVAAAMTLFALWHVDAPGGRCTARWVPWAFHAALAASFLTKFLAGPAFILAGCGLFTLVERRFRASLRLLLDPLGITIFLGLTVPWMLAAHTQCDTWLPTVLYHNFGRFSGDMGHNEPAWAYLYQVPFLVLPWSPVVLVGLVGLARRGLMHDARWRLLACWFLGGMTILSLMAFKTKHYTIPMLTPLAVVGAYGLIHVLAARRAAPHKRSWLLAALVAGGLGAGAWGVAESRLSPIEQQAIFVALGLIAVGGAAMILFDARNQFRSLTATAFATFAVVSIFVQWTIMPLHDSYRFQTEFAQVINATLLDGDRQAVAEYAQRHADDPQRLRLSPALVEPDPSGTLHMVGLPDNQITYYLRPRLERIDPLDDFLASCARSEDARPRRLLAPARVVAALDDFGQVQGFLRCQGLNRYQSEADRLHYVVWQPDLARLAVGASWHTPRR